MSPYRAYGELENIDAPSVAIAAEVNGVTSDGLAQTVRDLMTSKRRWQG